MNDQIPIDTCAVAPEIELLPVVPNTWDRKIARWVSRLANPAIIVAASSILVAAVVNTRAAWWWAGFEILVVVLLPVCYILWLVKSNKVTDFDVYLRNQRMKPYLFSLSCGAAALLAFIFGDAPRMFAVLASAGLLQTLLMALITLRWKISAHSATTASVAVFFWQLIGGWGALILLTIPLVAWSRVRLKRHTLAQTIGGAALGTLILLLAMAIFM